MMITTHIIIFLGAAPGDAPLAHGPVREVARLLDQRIVLQFIQVVLRVDHQEGPEHRNVLRVVPTVDDRRVLLL